MCWLQYVKHGFYSAITKEDFSAGIKSLSFSGHFGRIKTTILSSLHGNFMPSQTGNFLGSFGKLNLHKSPLTAIKEVLKTKVIYPKYYKNSNGFVLLLLLDRLGHQGSTEHFWTFAKLSYFLSCCFHIFMSKTNTKLEFLYMVVSALTSWLT